MAAQRAQPRAWRIDEHLVEGAVPHHGVQLQRVARERLGHLRAVALGALQQKPRLECVVVERRQDQLRAVGARRVALQQDGLRGAPGAHLQKRRRLPLGQHRGGNQLRGGVRHEDLALREHPLHLGKQQRARVEHAVAAGNVHAVHRHRVQPLVQLVERLDQRLVSRLRRVDGDEQRRLLVRGAHEVESLLRSEVGDELARQPQGERMQARERLGVAHGIAEGERLAHEHDLAQHRVRQTRRAHREGAHELHALVDGRMRRLAQEDDLVGAHSQRVAHVGLHVAGRVERAVDDLVERARGADHAEGQLRGECAILRREVRTVDARADDVLRERVALAHGAHHVERGQARGAGLRARLLLRVLRSGVALGLSRLGCFRHGFPPRSGRRP